MGRNLDDHQLVDLGELVGLGRRGAGHAGELLVEAEIVLEGDRSERDVLGLDVHVLLGLQSLVQAFRIAAARHHAAGELVDDDDFAIADDVVLVALEQLVGAQRLIDVVDQRRVAGFVEEAFLHQSGAAQQRLDMLVARLGQADRALLLVDVVVFAHELRDQRVDAGVKAGTVLRRAGNDQRRARLVDQDRVDFIDDGVGVAALDHLRHVVFHVVAQVVEAELVVGAVGDVGGVGLAALLVVEPVDDHADAHAEEIVDLPHPFRVAAGEIVVDGDDVHALAGEGVEIDGERGDQRLAFAGSHLGDRALVQHQAADQLDVKMTLLERALGPFAHHGESRRDQIVDRLAGGELGAKFIGLGA